MAGSANAANDWVNMLAVDPTGGLVASHICYSTNGHDVSCDSTAPFISGTTFVVSGTVSATNFVGNGSGLTGISTQADRITSGTTSVVANSATSVISITNAGTTSGYFNSNGVLTAPGISATANLTSVTTLYASGKVMISGSTYVSDLTILGVTSVSGVNPTVSASAAGADTQVQYNSSGNFAGSSSFTFSSGLLTVTNISTTNISVSTINGQPYSAGGGASDRITSGTTSAIANSATAYISLTTGATNWGYLSSGLSYLPNLTSNAISTTNISLTTINGLPYTTGGTSGTTNLSETISINDLKDASSTLASKNMFLGSGAGNLVTTGSANTGLGVASFASLTTGLFNVGVGYLALTANTTGGHNVAIGSALNANTTGGSNVALGVGALTVNTTGGSNVGIGESALGFNTTGSGNVGIGDSALGTVEGGDNIGLGDGAGNSLTSGTANIAIGANTFSFNDDAGSNQLNIGNVIYGDLFNGHIGINFLSPSVALEVNGTISATGLVVNGVSITGSGGGGGGSIDDLSDAISDPTDSGAENLILGYPAGANLTTGTQNTATGLLALSNVQDGTNNTANGYDALLNNTSGGYNTAVGYFTLETNMTGFDNIAVGDNALSAVDDSHDNVAMGDAALDALSSGNNNVGIGDCAGCDLTTGDNNIAIGANTSDFNDDTGSNQLNIGNVIYGDLSNGFIGIDTLTPSVQLEVNGTISATSLYLGGTLFTGSGTVPTLSLNDLTDAISDPTGGTNLSVLLGFGEATALTTGTFNTGVGYLAFQSIQDGSSNAAFGVGALSTLVSGTNNDAFGFNALLATNGTYNVGIGDWAGSGIAYGSVNVAIGQNAMTIGTLNGTNNVAIGDFAGEFTTGTYNVGIGSEAMGAQAITGNYNVGLGQFSLGEERGDYNIGLGVNSMASVSGSNNIGIGLMADYDNLGDNNIAIGNGAAESQVSGDNNIAIGENTSLNDSNGSNQLSIGNVIYGDLSNGFIGINVTSPSVALEVGGTVSATDFVVNGVSIVGGGGGGGSMSIDDLTDAISDPTGSISSSVFLGYGSGINVTTGSNNTAVGLISMRFDTTGYENSVLGYDALSDNLSGGDNVSVGAYSLTNNQTTDNNVAVGALALFGDYYGTGNVAIGSSAFESLGVSGTGNNVAIGNSAGVNQTDGANNITIGASSELNNLTGSNQLNIGNVIYGDLLNGHIGINVTSPSVALEVGGTISATALVVNGVSITGSGGGGTSDRITSGTTNVIANSATTYISLTTGATTWGYISSATSYIPTLWAGSISATGTTGTVSATYGYFTYISATNGLTGGSLSKTIAINDLKDASASVAIGSMVLGSTAGVSTSGASNTLIGYQAGNAITTGSENTAIGANALQSGSGLAWDTGVGSGALRFATGAWNTGVGVQALGKNTSGVDNTALGYGSGRGFDTGSQNTYVGYVAGGITASTGTGSQNAALGALALTANTSGNANVAVGYSAGSSVTGNSNTLIGDNTAASLTTGGSNIVLGYNANVPTASTSNWLSIGNAIQGSISSGNGNANSLGINVASPTASLEVSGTISATALKVNGVTITGSGGGSGDNITSGTTNVTVISSTKTISITVGGTTTGYFNSNGVLTLPGISATSNLTSVTTLYASGKVGVGITNPTSTFDVYGGSSSSDIATAIFSANSSGGGASLYIKNTNGTDNQSQLVLGSIPGVTSVGWYMGTDQTNNGADDFYIYQGSTGTPRFYINSSGNIGIGTLKPNAKLEVSGAISASNVYVTATTGTVSATYGYFTYISATNGLSGGGSIDGLSDASSTVASGDMFLGSGGGNLITTNGTQNTSVGIKSMTSATTAQANVAVGYSTMPNIITGFDNVAVGHQTMQNITTGSQNVAMGDEAGFHLTSGTLNVALGEQAFTAATTATQNIAIGYVALGNQVSSTGQVAIGYFSMENISGSAASPAVRNTAVGYQSLAGEVVPSAVTASDNAAFGYNALSGGSLSTASGNTAMGSNVGTGLITGNSNTLIGGYAGTTLTTGSNNIVIGANATVPTATANGQLNIGNAIWGSIISGTGNTNLIGINTNNPTASLEVSGTISATALKVNGVTITGSGGGSGDNITSGTTNVTVISSTKTISITVGGTTTGYFNSNGVLTAPGISATSNLTSVTTLAASGLVQVNGGILFNQGSGATNNLMYLGGLTSGPVDASLGFFAAGVGSGSDTAGPYFLARGNLFSATVGQRGNMFFAAGSPISPGADEGSLNFMSNGGVTRMIVDNAGNVGIGIGNTLAQASLEVSGTISATALKVNGVTITGSGGGSGDNITSGTTKMVAISSTKIISITTNGVNTGYFNSNGVLTVPGISATSNLTSVTTLSANQVLFTAITGGTGVNPSFSVSASGSDTYVQYNSGGNIAGTSGFTYVSSSSLLSVGGIISGTGLNITGDISYTGVLTDTSDRRLKHSITLLPAGTMEKLMLMKPVSYAKNATPGVTEFGFIAQDVEQIFPNLVFTASDAMGTKTMNYIGLIAPMVQGMQEQQRQIDALKAQNSTLLNRLDKLEKLVQTQQRH